MFYVSLFQVFGQNSKIDSLKNEFQIVKLDSSRVNILMATGDAFALEFPDSNLYYKKNALWLSEKGELGATPKIVLEIIKILGEQNNYSGVLNFGQQYYKKFERENHKFEHLSIGNDVGYAHYSLGNLDSSFYYLNYVILNADEKNEKGRSLMVNTLRMRASIYVSESNYDLAIIDLQKTLKLVDTSNYYEVYSIYATIADTYTQFGDYEKALENFDKANEYVQKTDVFLPKMHILYSYADFFRRFNKYERAHEYALKGVELAKANEQPFGEMILKSILAKTYIDLGQFNEAKPYLEFVVDLGTKFQADEIVAIAKYDLGTVANSNGNYALALSYCNEAWSFFNETSAFIHKVSACDCLSNANEGLGDFEQSLFYYKKAMVFKDSTNSEEQIKKTYRLQNKYELEKKEAIFKAEQEQQKIIADQKLKTKNQFIIGIGILAFFLIGIVFMIFKNIQRKKESRHLLEKEKSQTKFSQDLIQFQEDEKIRISRELHDSVGQDLILLKTKATAIKNEEFEELIRTTLENIRNITQNLHPFVLEKFGLTAALNKLVNSVDETTDLFVTNEIEDIDGVLNKSQELNTYRIVQEALNNVLKHSDSPSVLISAINKAGSIEIKVQDYGKGFDYNEKSDLKNSLGMKTLEERANIINTKLIILSQKSKGTTIHLKIPKQYA